MDKSLKHIMLDLETASTKKNAAITSIGACIMDFSSGVVTDTFYAPVIIESYTGHESAFHLSPSTFAWWLKQSKEAQDALFDPNALHFQDALALFARWVNEMSSGNLKDVRMWGNGADFDNVIMGTAFETVGVEVPWRYSGNRCFRTIKNSHPELMIGDNLLKHRSISDAIWQADYLIGLHEKYGLEMR